MGIEPTRPAWKAGVLPLNYTRIEGYHRRQFQALQALIQSFTSSDVLYYITQFQLCQVFFEKKYLQREMFFCAI